MNVNKLYNIPYHQGNISECKFLITGGAGFIGSNLVEYLIKYNAYHVRVLDNLSSGYYDNIKKFIPLKNFEFIEGDIRDLETCKKAVKGMDYVSHQAALGSVPRSILDPILVNDVNIGGFLNVLVAVKDATEVKKMVYAASSSTYGDSIVLPKVEGNEGNPLSPYAVTKAVNEIYAEVFSKVYNLNTIGLRYFNVFGPNQNSNNPYAAVIPIFCKAFIEGKSPIINGDGETSRDFTFVENAVQANILAFTESILSKHKVFNVACGQQISLNSVLETLKEISGKSIQAVYQPERQADVRHSKASIEKIQKELGYKPSLHFKEGLKIVYDYYLNEG